MLKKYIYLVIAIIGAFLTGCIDDSFSTSPSDQPTFSTDTLNMGTVFTEEQTATHRFTVYNPHSKGMNIADIAMSGADASLFRLNVDGMSGKSFQNVEIRANDSIFVFVSADIPEGTDIEPRKVEAKLDFTVNGLTSTVVLTAKGQDIKRMKGVVLEDDTTLEAGLPYQITDSLVVKEGVTLTLKPGALLMFHDNASLIVRGTLKSEGTAEKHVKLTGDRMGNVITDVSFDLMSRQWAGIEFTAESNDNVMEYTEVSNTCYGVTIYGDGQDIETKRLTLVNCRLHNSGENVLSAIGASVEAYGCEFAESAYCLVYLVGGDHRFDHCTASNHYLFSAVSGAAWMIVDISKFDDYADFKPTKALITNSITYGLGSDVNPGDLTGTEVYFKRCLFKSNGEDDDNFINSIWGEDPLFYTVRNEYIFDYRIKPESPAIAAADSELSERPLETDYYGVKRRYDLGAYVYVEPEE